MKKYSYLILLMLTFLIGMPIVLNKLYGKEEQKVAVGVGEKTDTHRVASASSASKTLSVTPQPEKDTKVPPESETQGEPSEQQDTPVQTETEIIHESEVMIEQEQQVQEEEKSNPVLTQVDRSYFSDAIFIGDSRTLGLAEYADLGGADIFAGSGMSVFDLFDSKNRVAGQNENLRDMLSQKTYGKIYFMMGINDLGYNFEVLEKQYKTVVGQLKEVQPNAILYLCANMHVTSSKSGKDPYFNNDNINRLNGVTEALALETGSIYLNINQKFDDENGALQIGLTHDEVHVLGKHYMEWSDWLCENAIIR